MFDKKGGLDRQDEFLRRICERILLSKIEDETLFAECIYFIH